MLTLQQLLESDSLATIVAKLNNNFQILNASNGGPQGVRGQQGIPGLPGRIGPLGPTGAQGPTGTLLGIVPFACISDSTAGVGPTSGQLAPNSQPAGEWPLASWTWLMTYHGAGIVSSFTGLSAGTGTTARPGDIYIDHANKGYWKYLESVDEPGACDPTAGTYPAEYLNGGIYSVGVTGSYPDFSNGLGWTEPGWYWYSTEDPSSVIGGNVWVNDITTYLFSPTAAGPYPGSTSTPLSIPNARLESKYGSVWITSGNEFGDDNDFLTGTIEEWGGNTGGFNPARLNSGVDRLLFKMSIDTIPYLGNITARGFTALSGPAWVNSTSYPESANGTAMQSPDENTYWVKPQYSTTLEKYSPLLFLSEKNSNSIFNDNSSLGLYMHTAPDGEGKSNLNKSLFLWSSRYAPDPVEMYPTGFTGIDSASTKNFGEFIMDTRRLITSNQYVCSSPTDMKLSGDWIDYSTGPNPYYEESNGNNSNRYRTYQGYISSINGKSITGNPSAIDYWEYGLGDGTTYGLTGGTHDTASGTAGMQTRNTWYGSSVFDDLPSSWNSFNPGEGNYIRVAGMMDRGRRFDDLTDVAGVGTGTNFLSELVFYTSHFNYNLGGNTGLSNTEIDPTLNSHKSLPVMYMSPYRNIGIGTFVGNTFNTNDAGPLEPSALLHVHTKQRLREDDPTYVYSELTPGVGAFDVLLPNEVFAAAAFSGDYGGGAYNYVTDILLGNLYTQNNEWVNPATSIGDVVNRMSDNQTVDTSNNFLRNAIRSESWYYTRHNTLRLGAQPFLGSNTIGRGDVTHYKNEFQLSIHPLIKNSALDMSNSNQAISGVGIHNLYPRTRAHFYGKNLYNEVDFGEELVYPSNTISSGLTGIYPYYGPTASNQPSNNQVVIDYIGDSYTYPVGIYEYQYLSFGATANPSSTGTTSPNSAVYPRRDSIAPTRHLVPYDPDYVNEAYPSTDPNVVYNNSYKHGGTANAWWEPTSYIGFNLFRDVSEAGTTGGDNRDNTRWVLGRSDNANSTSGNNGGSAIISSPYGELGIITIPKGRDGGLPYTQWEQRGLGTRDVLNQMKIVFDRNGNIAVGNAAGWDLDAYPSLDRDPTNGLLYYVPNAGATATAPATAGTNPIYNWVNRWNQPGGQYGLVSYSGYPENATTSSAALINSQATTPEYIRLEVAAEKAWSRDGRMAQKTGWGYPANSTISIVGVDISTYVLTDGTIPAVSDFTFITDEEGRVAIAEINLSAPASGVTSGNFEAIVFPHPTEFDALGPLSAYAPPGFVSPVGAIAAEWWGMNDEVPSIADLGVGSYSQDTVLQLVSPGTKVYISLTTDTRGAANVRLNNFVYGEGWGFSGITATGDPNTAFPGTFTESIVKAYRQQSPKLIFTFLEGAVSPSKAALRGAAGSAPYKKVNTVVQSAQNEVSLREYWIPKADNTGGTFMVFTDHFGSKEKTDGFDTTSIKVTTTGTGGVTGDYGLHLDQVVTMEFLAGYTATSGDFITDRTTLLNGIDGFDVFGVAYKADNMYPGYVRYSNRDYTWPGQDNTAFTSSQYARKRPVGDLDSTTEIRQLGANRDGQYTVINIETVGSTAGYLGLQNDVLAIGLADEPGCVALKINDDDGTTPFTNSVIEDSDYIVTGTGLTGSVAIAPSSTELVFYPNLNPTPDLQKPDRIKVTIDFAAAGSTGSRYEEVPGPLFLGLIPDDGGNFSKTHMVASCVNNNYYGRIFKTTNENIADVRYSVFENQISFYIPYTDWIAYATWKMGMMVVRVNNEVLPSPTAANFNTYGTDPGTGIDPSLVLQLAKFTVKFEEIYNPADSGIRYQDTEILPLTTEVANLSTVQRNIDHFYNIYSPSSNYDSNLGIDSKASAIRFKRINSEFALVDFNITVKVNNPVLPGGSANDSFSYIDFCSPRFTQYLRFIYVPDEDFDSEPSYRQDISQDIYGNGMWFSQWSTYKQWYAGTAIVGNESTARSYYTNNGNSGLKLGPGLKTSTSDGSPFYTEPGASGGPTFGFRTWTGNYLDILSHYVHGGSFFNNTFREHSIYKSEGNVSPASTVVNNYGVSAIFTSSTENERSGIYSAFGSDRRILQIAKAMFNRVGVSSEAGAKQLGFVQFLSAAYSLWHNHTYMRNKNVQWRMVPIQSYKYEPGATSTLLTQNNSFVLEVQFSDPMLHVDTPLGERVFLGSGSTTATDGFYQYLTVNGQAIVRYAESNSDGNFTTRNLNP